MKLFKYKGVIEIYGYTNKPGCNAGETENVRYRTGRSNRSDSHRPIPVQDGQRSLKEPTRFPVLPVRTITSRAKFRTVVDR